MSNDEQQQERQKHWDDFLLEYLPQNILDVFPDNALQDLLRGFFLKIRRGVTILYGQRNVDNQWRFDQAIRIDPFDEVHDINSEFSNPICSALRRALSNENRCSACDTKHAIEFAGNPTPDGWAYSCWLGLFDLLYPVKLDGETIAFVVGGQIPPDTEEELAQLKVKLRAFGEATANNLIASLDDDVQRRQMTGRSAAFEIETTRQELCVFVKALERIMADLHAAAQRKSVGELLDYWESSLPTVDHTAEAQWWQRVATLAEEFLAQIGMSHVRLLVRAGKYFNQQWPNADAISEEGSVRVATRDVLQAVPPDRLMPADNDQTRALAAQIVKENACVYFYRTRAASADAQPGLLFAVEGQPSPQFRDLGEKFLRRISSRTEYAALTFQLKRMYEQYKQTVADAAHDFRHPLQNFDYILADLLQLPSIKQDQSC